MECSIVLGRRHCVPWQWRGVHGHVSFQWGCWPWCAWHRMSRQLMSRIPRPAAPTPRPGGSAKVLTREVKAPTQGYAKGQDDQGFTYAHQLWHGYSWKCRSRSSGSLGKGQRPSRAARSWAARCCLYTSFQAWLWASANWQARSAAESRRRHGLQFHTRAPPRRRHRPRRQLSQSIHNAASNGHTCRPPGRSRRYASSCSGVSQGSQRNTAKTPAANPVTNTLRSRHMCHGPVSPVG